MGYFLVVWDFIKFAHDHRIPAGLPRLGRRQYYFVLPEITGFDPPRYGWFLNGSLTKRVTPPDFDIDFTVLQRRGYRICWEKYGRENVAQIITLARLAQTVIRGGRC